MGHRMYIVRKGMDGKWERLYSHWGASVVEKFIKERFRVVVDKRYAHLNEGYKKLAELREQYFDIRFEGIKNFRKLIEELINYEMTKKNEEWEPMDKLEIYLDAIDIEIWIVDNGKDLYIVLPFISNTIYGGIISKIFDDPYEDYKTLHIYEKYSNYIIIISDAVRDGKISKEVAINTALEHFRIWDYEGGKFRFLTFGEKLNREYIKIIEGSAFIIY